MELNALKYKAAQIRSSIYDMVVTSQRGHIGGAFSCTDILTALYYSGILRFDPNNHLWPGRDRLILSKGHSGIALFAILADLGFFPAEKLKTFCQNNSMLGGHPDRRVPGIEADTGSLGHGLGIGTGMALSSKIDGNDILTFVLMGDGECYEGSVWEAFLFSAHHKLVNLVAIIDRNGQCVMDYTEECVKLNPMSDKLKAFGWDVAEIDGHSFKQLLNVLSSIRNRNASRPMAIIANTLKGKGISFMEGSIKWHHGVPNKDEDMIARHELWEAEKEYQP